jgi:hypothetical protein
MSLPPVGFVNCRKWAFTSTCGVEDRVGWVLWMLDGRHEVRTAFAVMSIMNE